jgi:hypothetical protein
MHTHPISLISSVCFSFFIWFPFMIRAYKVDILIDILTKFMIKIRALVNQPIIV